MSISASAVARGVGIETRHRDLSGGAARFLPQRIAVFAQGQTGVSVNTEKFQVTGGSKQVATRAGYNSPAYHIAREFWPSAGGGVGNIPVDFYLLAAAGGSTAAAGGIDLTGTATRAASYVPVIGGVRCAPVTVAKTESSVSKILEAVRQSIAAKLGVAVTPSHTYGSPSAAWTRAGGTPSNGTVGTFTTTGLPKAGDWTLTCTAEASNAGTFTLVDPDGVTIATDITIGANVEGGLGFTLADGSEDFNVGDVAVITVPSTDLVATVAWTGESGNDVILEIDGPTDAGLTWTVTQPTGGAGNPSLAGAIAQVGGGRTTMILNALNIGDTDALDALQAWNGNPDEGTGRWAATVRRPVVAFVGSRAASVDDATEITSGRTDDLTNVQLVAPGSNNLPCVIAAAQLARIARIANDNPPHDYGSQRASSLNPGLDSEQWSWEQRDAAIKLGTSTVEVKVPGVVSISDVVTMYAPEGEEPPAYRYVCDIVKLQNVLYNFDLVFESDEWDGKPLIADGQATVNPEAKRAADAKTAQFGIIDRLALSAIIADPKFSKENCTADVNATNSKRLDMSTTVKLAGNTNIKAITLNWGFFYG